MHGSLRPSIRVKVMRISAQMRRQKSRVSFQKYEVNIEHTHTKKTTQNLISNAMRIVHINISHIA